MPDKPTILFVTPILCHPPKGGPELRIENSIKALSQCSELYIYGRLSVEAAGGEGALGYYRRYAKEIFIAPSGKRRNIVRRAARHAVHLAIRCATGRSLKAELDFRSVLNTANTIKADLIWLGFGNISYPLLAYLKKRCAIPVVVDTDSVWSRFVLRGLPYAKDDRARAGIDAEGRAKEQEESWGTKLADVTTAVSEVDATYYRALAHTPGQVHLFSNVIDLSSYRRVPPPPGFKSPSVFLAGTFGKESPMEDAALWLIGFVLPIVKRELPEIHFYIAGVQSREVLAEIRDPNVSILGEVDSVLPYLSNATVSVVPLRFESGTRFKILEAGACRTPVVSTTLGAEGIPVTHGKDIMIADTPEDFAHSIVEVVKDRQLSVRLGENLRELVSQHFSVQALALEGRKILKHLGFS